MTRRASELFWGNKITERTRADGEKEVMEHRCGGMENGQVLRKEGPKSLSPVHRKKENEAMTVRKSPKMNLEKKYPIIRGWRRRDSQSFGKNSSTCSTDKEKTTLAWGQKGNKKTCRGSPATDAIGTGERNRASPFKSFRRSGYFTMAGRG